MLKAFEKKKKKGNMKITNENPRGECVEILGNTITSRYIMMELPSIHICLIRLELLVYTKSPRMPGRTRHPRLGARGQRARESIGQFV